MNITVPLVFILMINALLLMSQTSVDALAVEEGITTPVFFTYDESLLQGVDAGNWTVTEEVNFDNLTGGQVEVDSGNVFTDTFSALKGWVADATGFNALMGFIKAMPNFLKIIGLPPEIAFSLGALWHILTVFLVISWIGGRL